MLDSDSKNASQGECEALTQNAIEGSGSYVLGTRKCRSSYMSGANDYRRCTQSLARCGPAGGQ